MKEPRSAEHSSLQKAKYFSIVLIGIELFNIPFSFLPVIGTFSTFFGIFGIVVSFFAFRIYRKQVKPPRLPVAGFLLSLIVLSLGIRNGYKYQEVLGFLAVGAAATTVINQEVTKAIKEGIKQEVVKKAKEKISGKSQSIDAKPIEHQIVEENTELPTETQLQKKTKGPVNAYFYSIVDQLRVRKKPDTDSEVLVHLNFGEQVRYLNERSAEKENIVLAGKERNDYWYKIEQLGGFEEKGWVYGGGIMNATEGPRKLQEREWIIPFNFIRGDSLEALIGRPVGGFINSGLMTFKEGTVANSNSNGRFYFIGFSGSDYGEIPGYGDSGDLKGTMKNGKLNGEFIENQSQFESWTTLKINFDEGNCLSYEMVKNAEGEISKASSNNPTDCSDDHIRSEMRYVN